MAEAVVQQQPRQQEDAASLADELYAPVADDVAAFFEHVIDQGSGIVDQAYVDVEVHAGEPVCRYRTEQSGRTFRHVPLDDHDWHTYLQEVYASEVAALYSDDNSSADGRIDRRPVYPDSA